MINGVTYLCDGVSIKPPGFGAAGRDRAAGREEGEQDLAPCCAGPSRYWLN